jgi:hypothetical protein
MIVTSGLLYYGISDAAQRYGLVLHSLIAYAVQRAITLVAPLHAALTAQRAVPTHLQIARTLYTAYFFY